MTAALRVEERAAPYLVAPLLTEHLDTFASAPEGFKRLRELVLNLAVRGMLVPQNSNDEPAEKLLERIRAVNIRTIPEPIHAAPHELPPSWAWTTLGEITNVGETVKAGTLHNDTWVLDLEDIEKDTSRVVCKVRFSERRSKSDKNVFAAGDVLYGKLRPYLNKVIVADEPGVCTTEILPLRGYESVDANYIKTFLKSPGFIEYVNAKSYGMKMPRLGTTDARRAYFALPPLAEQSRIVAKVEELMALIAALEAKVGAGGTARGRLLDVLLAALADSPDAAATADAWAQLAPHFDLLLQTPADVDRLQQTLLQLAVKGRLVPQDPKDEPAAELLKRIRAEKERLVTEGKFKRDKPLPAINEDTLPYELPQCWHWSRLGSLGDSFDYGTSQKATETPRGTPVLRMGNVQAGTVTLTNLKYFEDGQCELPYLYLQPGDLLFNRTNSYELVGKTGIFKGEPQRYSFASYLIRIRANTHAIDPQYLNLYMNSLNCRLTQIEPQVVQQNGQANFNGTKLQAICIPLPPLPEQSRIVAAIASLTTLCDRLRERLTARRALSAKLAAALTESALQ